MSHEEAEAEQRVVVPGARMGAEELRLPPEDLAAQREKLIARLVEAHPIAGDDEILLQSLRGETNARVVDLPAELSSMAPLIARAYALLDREMELRPERFPPLRGGSGLPHPR